MHAINFMDKLLFLTNVKRINVHETLETDMLKNYDVMMYLLLPPDAKRKHSTSYWPVSVCPSVCHTRVLHPNG